MELIDTESLTLEKIHQLALDNEIAFVSFSLPGSDDITTLLQWSNPPECIEDISQLENQTGFVFAPFQNRPDTPLRLIKPDLVISGERFTEIDENEKSPLLPTGCQGIQTNPPVETSKQQYIDQVNFLRGQINNSALDKLVLSRISLENKPEKFNPSTFFSELNSSYPDAFVFMLYIAGAGLWFGASPEPLLQKKKELISTVSLAGTRVYENGQSALPWGNKELEEQEIVTRYIENILKDFGVSKFKKEGPVSYKAGKVEHLQTKFSFAAKDMQGDLLSFVKALHPTPSVCGIPKELALKVINKTECHNREYYTGFLGPVNMNEQWNLFVNLRSMKVTQDKLAYYLGAGITAGSEADKEWDETNNKKKTLQSIIESLKQV